MERVLVSACLLGQAVRYDGGAKPSHHPILCRWLEEGRVVPVCPEISGGLPVPRAAAEIVGLGGGEGVLRSKAKVVDAQGQDVSVAFLQGAQHALAIAQAQHIRVAVLKERSPSCGSSGIYAGRFDGSTLAGAGVTTALLRSEGLWVFSEEKLPEADRVLAELEATKLG